MQRILVLFLTLTILLSGCAEGSAPPAPEASAQAAPSPTSETITIVDALGRSVTLPGAPTRIVITGKGLIMIADAAYIFPQAAERIVGLGNATQGAGNFISLIDPRYSQKSVLTNDAGAEQMVALTPDLVILKSSLAETMEAPLTALGIPVIFVDFETPEQYGRDLRILGQVFQDEARADEAAAYFADKAAWVEATANGADEKPRVLLLYASSKDGSVAFNVPPEAWIQTRMVEMAGGVPIWLDASLGKGWTQVSLEQVAAWDADVILVVAYTSDPEEMVAGLKIDPNWQGLRAVQTGRLYAFAGDLYSWDQPDVRWILGLEWLAGMLHPDLFTDLDMRAEVRTFYAGLYGLEAAFVDENILPTLRGQLP